MTSRVPHLNHDSTNPLGGLSQNDMSVASLQGSRGHRSGSSRNVGLFLRLAFFVGHNQLSTSFTGTARHWNRKASTRACLRNTDGAS